MPAPSDVFANLVSGAQSGFYYRHIWATLSSAALGFLIGGTAALVIAGLLASSRAIERVMMPFIIAFQALPRIAIAPLILIWFGYGLVGKVTIVAVVVFFPMLLTALQGFRVRDPNYLDLMAILGANRWQLWRHIRLPGSLPYVFSGIHIGVIYSLIGTVVAEFISSGTGLGFALIVAQSQFATDTVFAVLIILMAIGSALFGITRWLEKRALFWATEVDQGAG
nr:ABC transporter permease [Ornithinimicrobium sp. HY1745]